MNESRTMDDLLNWLETHLDQPLSLDQVAARSGYSKWHLQRKFKETTGQVLGAYIRARRLSNASMALRLTSKPLAAIAQQYCFESQQSFNRAFKQQFSQTPALYRRSMKWDFHGFQPPLGKSNLELPQGKFVTLPEMQLAGVTECYTCSLEQLSQCRTQLRERHWRRFLEQAQINPSVLYGLCCSGPESVKNGGNEVWYTTAVEAQYLSEPLANVAIHRLNLGDYVQFTYKGVPEGLQGFILELYGICLPLMQVVRRDGYDIEQFHQWPDPHAGDTTDWVHCEYLIPIVR
ncbi:helix-turn-helix domain-containing protein [Acerihabitans sp. TG2]|uniref:helix-turn-helix domain-containing protein n=1 Tax=Acerihabitans sp. TG2 TaxID=3096008 RepID=UPI003A5993C6